MRFVFEVIHAIRAEIGCDFTLVIRLCGDELIPAGLTLDDVRDIARRLEATGQLDFINTGRGCARYKTWKPLVPVIKISI